MTKLIYVIDTVTHKDTKALMELGKWDWLISYYSLSKKKNLDSLLSNLNKPKDSIFILDSGAFSAWNKGIQINLRDYIEFIKQYHRYFTHIVCLDVIDNPINSEVNHLVMRQELAGYDLTIIPVFHSGESFKVLDYFIEQGYGYIGISPNNGWKEDTKRKWLDLVFASYDFEKLGIKTHAFGYTSQAAFNKYNFTTADSNSYVMVASIGGVETIHGERVVTEANQDSRNIQNVAGGISDYILDVCNQLGFTLDDLKASKINRVKFNILSRDILSKQERVSLSYKQDLFMDEDLEAIPFNVKSLEENYQYALSLGECYRGYLNEQKESIKES